jgi:hypothetical protein
MGEMNEMSRIVRILVFMQLPTIPGIHKKLEADQGVQTLGETTGFASKTGEIMSQLSIHTFHAIGFAFVGHGGMRTGGIEQGFAGRKQVTVVPDGLRTVIEHGL